MDPYQTLGVDQSASDQQIKAAFRKLAVQYHPDRGGDENKFKEINEAYDKIKTQEKRQQYEASKRFGGDGFNFNFSQGDPFDMQDMFTQFFGEGFANFPDSIKGPDNLLKLGLSFSNMNQKNEACSAFYELEVKYKNSPKNVLERSQEERKKLNCPEE